MSHTTTISTLLLSDETAIRAAIAELSSKGVKCELLENAVPRAYYDNQMGQADMVVKLDNSRYDVGLYKKADGTFEAKADFWGKDVEKALGANPAKDDNATQAKLGKFFSLYAAHAATRKAVQQGYSVRRIDKADGGIQLQVTR
jgi:Protein of unknown function (DUF1257)